MERARGSWWIKLDRAEQHLEEIEAYISRYSKTRPYTFRREIEGYDDHEFVVRAFLIDPPDYELAAIFGDFFYNVRSALDHIAVAAVPDQHRRSASFPIFTDDPRRAKKSSVRRRSFERSTKGMSAPFLAEVEALQPYTRYPKAPEFDPLAILDGFAQADKHRELVAFARYLRNPATTISTRDGTIQFTQSSPGKAYADGGIVARFPLAQPLDETQVNVHVHGAIEVGLKHLGANATWEIPDSLTQILAYVRKAVLKPLEGLLPSV